MLKNKYGGNQPRRYKKKPKYFLIILRALKKTTRLQEALLFLCVNINSVLIHWSTWPITQLIFYRKNSLRTGPKISIKVMNQHNMGKYHLSPRSSGNLCAHHSDKRRDLKQINMWFRFCLIHLWSESQLLCWQSKNNR